MWKPYEPKHADPEPLPVYATIEKMAESMGVGRLTVLATPRHADVWPPASVSTARKTDPWWNVTR